MYKLTNELAVDNFAVATETKMVSTNVHHLWIIDRSGSMGSTLPKVIDDLKKQVRTLKIGDALSFGWFSSEGKFRFPAVITRIVDEKSYAQLDKMFDENRNVIGMTCFSEILNETLRVIKDAEFLGFPTSCLFFSDGYANDPSVRTEYARVRELMPKLAEALDSFLTVAHTNYADREFLTEMAELGGGEAVSSDSLEAFTRLMDKYLRSTMSLTPRQVVKIDVPKDKLVGAFAFGEDTVNSFLPNEEGFVQSNKDVWAIVPNNGTLVSAPLEVAYSAALILNRKGKVDQGLEVLGEIGDKFLIDKVDRAITPAEKGLAEEFLKEAIFNPRKRFLEGKVANYLPDPNAFCVLNLVDLLVNDPQARFYPKHPEFKYNRIGLPAVQKEGYEEFKAYLENSCPINSFSWNKEFLNLSLKATIEGTVKLPFFATKITKEDGEEKKELIARPKSLGNIKETFQHRDFTLIKDGFLNIKKLPITASIETLVTLFEAGLIDEYDAAESIAKDKPVVLNLTKIPVVNKAIAKQDLSAKGLLSDVLEEASLLAQQKVLTSLRKEVAPEAPKVQNDWTEQEREFFLATGFREDGSYQPPVEKGESTDHYDAVSFTTYIKGVKSLPALKDLRTKLDAISAATKNSSTKVPELTFALELMRPIYNEFVAQAASSSIEDQVKWIDAKLKGVKIGLSQVRDRIQRPKFTLLLGKKWFNDLEEVEAEQTLTFFSDRFQKDVTGVIQIKKVPVNI